MLKWIMKLSCWVLLSSVAVAQDGTPVMMPGSLITAQQTLPVQTIVQNWLTKYKTLKVDLNDIMATIPEARAEMINGINGEMLKDGVPQITDGPNLKVAFPAVNGYSGPFVVGINLKDEKTNFCFPCDDGKSSFVWGVAPVAPVTPATK